MPGNNETLPVSVEPCCINNVLYVLTALQFYTQKSSQTGQPQEISLNSLTIQLRSRDFKKQLQNTPELKDTK